jgi:hypothetical protein
MSLVIQQCLAVKYPAKVEIGKVEESGHLYALQYSRQYRLAIRRVVGEIPEIPFVS